MLVAATGQRSRQPLSGKQLGCVAPGGTREIRPCSYSGRGGWIHTKELPAARRGVQGGRWTLT